MGRLLMGEINKDMRENGNGRDKQDDEETGNGRVEPVNKVSVWPGEGRGGQS